MAPRSWFLLLTGPPRSPPTAAEDEAEGLFGIFTLPERPRTKLDNQEGEDNGEDDEVGGDREDEDGWFITEDI